jgi:hypothetical protein
MRNKSTAAQVNDVYLPLFLGSSRVRLFNRKAWPVWLSAPVRQGQNSATPRTPVSPGRCAGATGRSGRQNGTSVNLNRSPPVPPIRRLRHEQSHLAHRRDRHHHRHPVLSRAALGRGHDRAPAGRASPSPQPAKAARRATRAGRSPDCGRQGKSTAFGRAWALREPGALTGRRGRSAPADGPRLWSRGRKTRSRCAGRDPRSRR